MNADLKLKLLLQAHDALSLLSADKTRRLSWLERYAVQYVMRWIEDEIEDVQAAQ